MLAREWQGTAEHGPQQLAATGYCAARHQETRVQFCVDSEGQRLCVNVVTTASV